MSDPLALVPYACAARRGRVGNAAAGELVAAGTTLLVRSAALVRALAGRRAGILLPNGGAFLVALGACDGRGAVLINPVAAPLEIAAQLRDANVGAVFTTAALSKGLPAGTVHVLLDDAPRAATVVADGASKAIDLGSHVGLDLEGDPDTEGRDEEAAVVYTSAMAGRPLGAVLTHRALLHNARAVVAVMELGPEDRVLASLPFAHLFGFTGTLLAPLLAGATVLADDRFSPARAAARLSSGEATIAVGVPAVYRALLAVLERQASHRLAGTVRLCICGGAPLETELQQRWEDRTGVPLRQGYGLTEAGPVSLFNYPSEPNRLGTLGRAFPGVRVSIRDPDTGTELERGRTGEICVGGGSLFSGYLNDTGQGLAVRDGWLHTGDLGAMDPDGVVTFAGVRKAMFTRNGFNIYPRELESAVCELPGVEWARVEAVPNAERENDVRLTVRGSVAREGILAWCARRLSAYKQPADVIVLRDGSDS